MLVYVTHTDKLIEGSPENSTSKLPILPWGTSGELPECADWMKGKAQGKGVSVGRQKSKDVFAATARRGVTWRPKLPKGKMHSKITKCRNQSPCAL